LLLLDEPTSNLDPASVRDIATLLQRLECAVVVITRDVALAASFAIRYTLHEGALLRDAHHVAETCRSAVHG
jgi:ATP-binding cassette subfamily B protein RaxB